MADIASSDVTYTIQTERKGGVRPLRTNVVKVVFGDGALTYPSGGVPLSGTSLGLPEGVIESLKIVDGDDSTGIVWKYNFASNTLRGYDKSATRSTGTVDDNDSAATNGHKVYVIPAAGASSASAPTAEASAVGLLHDDDAAASAGVAVYVVVDDANWSPTYQLGHFEFVSPTDANGSCTVADGGPTLTLFDNDDAATAGVVIRAVAAGGGIEATTAAAKDILVPVSNGKYIHVNHATTGSTPQVYFDEDAAATHERLLAVVVDNADEPYSLFITPGEESPRTPDRSLRLASLVTVGPKPFVYTVGSGGPEISVPSRPDAASIPGAVELFVQAAGAGFNAKNFGKEDVYVPTSTGSFVKVAYAASPAGVQVYGVPEAASADLMFQGVIADNADETFATETSIGWQGGSLSELVASVSTPASQTLYVEATGY